MRKLEHCASCLPQSLIVGYSLCCCNTSYVSQEKKRKVSYATFKKWRRDFDREFKTVSWLECESAVEGGTKVVRKLKCSVCGKFRSSIIHKKNFSDRWITGGADSICTSHIRNHATSEQHGHTMSLLSQEQAKTCASNIVETALRFNLRVSYFSKFPGGACPQTPLEGLCFALRSVLHTLSYTNILWPYNFTYGQSNLLLIGHSVQAINYRYIVLCAPK